MAATVKYPAPGCIVEYLEDNSIQIAMIMEESGGKLRLLLPSRRETKLSSNRLLPWYGPLHSSSLGREEAVRLLESHKKERELKQAAIDPVEVWNVAAGEIDNAPPQWFAELFVSDPDADTVAAFGRALLGCKTHFRLQSPQFEVFDEGLVNKRMEERKAREEREALIEGGADFLHRLWILAQKREVIDQAEAEKAIPDKQVAERIERLLHARLLNPDTQEEETLWNQISKGLPEVPHLPVQLLTAWGKIPHHYNFWLDRADFEAGDTWWEPFDEEIKALIQAADRKDAENLKLADFTAFPFISIDGSSTLDIDDAFYIEEAEDGWTLIIALAIPALAWLFGSAFDKKIMHRGTSLYLPEQTMHMLPECLGTGAYSLFTDNIKPAFCLKFRLDKNGQPLGMEPLASRVRLAANLHYDQVQNLLDGNNEADKEAKAFKIQLQAAHKLALLRENARIEAGAVIMHRSEPVIHLSGDSTDPLVDITLEEPHIDAQRLVAEMMVLASSSLADWAYEREIPLIHRTQNVTVPREYSGVWEEPEDLARIIRALMPSILEVDAKPHAALALPRYAPITSPLRRYADLVNEAQILKFLESGKPRWSREELEAILSTLGPVLEQMGQVQRFRPRYWKLLYFRQKGDKEWWPAVITEENESFVNISLPEKGLFVRGRRNQFDERACPGTKVNVRLGKVNPLYNEIHILEVMPAE